MEVQCVNHLDCSNGNMCAGDGMCVKPVVSFNNSRDVEIETHVYAPSCDEDEKVGVYGHSPWEQVPDMLRANGLCSHRKWYEYRKMIMEQEKQGLCKQDTDLNGVLTAFGGGICNVPTRTAHWEYTGTEGEGEHRPEISLQQDGVLSVHAHTCDRDFMHIDGYAQCQPRKAITRSATGRITNTAFGRSFATYTTPDNSTIPYVRMPYFSNTQAGFLGTNRNFQDKTTMEDDIQPVPCSSIAHCSLQPFTIRGFEVPNRLVFTTTSLTARDYKLQDAIRCGAFGYLQDHLQRS
ncbi:hypothetical protein T484DRAFT_1758509, partial [Baffinella frigidus]